MVADSQIIYLDGLIDNLDNKAAEEVWKAILARRRTEGTAFVIATTRAEVADRCDTVALMHEGRMVAMGTPAQLKSKVQSDAVLIDAIRNPLIKSKIKKQFAVAVEQADGMLKIRSAETLGTVLGLLADYGSEVGAVYLKQPGLCDVLDKAIEGKQRNA
jgi:ABC-2 type transport system ATP-binding protein